MSSDYVCLLCDIIVLLISGGTDRIVEAPLNVEYTFDVFMCVSILMEHRATIFQCTDAADVFQFICR